MGDNNNFCGVSSWRLLRVVVEGGRQYRSSCVRQTIPPTPVGVRRFTNEEIGRRGSGKRRTYAQGSRLSPRLRHGRMERKEGYGNAEAFILTRAPRRAPTRVGPGPSGEGVEFTPSGAISPRRRCEAAIGTQPLPHALPNMNASLCAVVEGWVAPNRSFDGAGPTYHAPLQPGRRGSPRFNP